MCFYMRAIFTQYVVWLPENTKELENHSFCMKVSENMEKSGKYVERVFLGQGKVGIIFRLL